MSDCEFFGNCPEPEATLVDEAPMEEEAPMEGEMMEGDMMMEEDLSGWKKDKELADPFMGNVNFAVLAGINVFGYAADIFRYKKDDVYTAGDNLRLFNSWKIYTYIEKYAGLGLWSVAFITQILATFGIAVPINVLVWRYGIFMAGGLITLFLNLLMFFAYDSAYSLSKDKDLVKAASGASVQMAVETDMFYAMIHETANAISLYKYMDDWKAAQWQNLTPEERQAAIDMEAERKEGKKEEMEMEGEEMMEEEPVEETVDDPFALFQF